MANVFTAANLLPRSTTLSDYRGHDATKHRVYPRILSPTRRANPHPIGLKYQLITQKKPSYGIWHPDFHQIGQRMPDMLKHLGHVNFTCSLPVIHKLEYGKPPNIRYTETTTARRSYVQPCRFPQLVKMNPHSRKTRYGYTPAACRKPVKGIVPNLELKEYDPVPELWNTFKIPRSIYPMLVLTKWKNKTIWYFHCILMVDCGCITVWIHTLMQRFVI